MKEAVLFDLHMACNPGALDPDKCLDKCCSHEVFGVEYLETVARCQANSRYRQSALLRAQATVQFSTASTSQTSMSCSLSIACGIVAHQRTSVESALNEMFNASNFLRFCPRVSIAVPPNLAVRIVPRSYLEPLGASPCFRTQYCEISPLC